MNFAKFLKLHLLIDHGESSTSKYHSHLLKNQRTKLNGNEKLLSTQKMFRTVEPLEKYVLLF